MVVSGRRWRGPRPSGVGVDGELLFGMFPFTLNATHITMIIACFIQYMYIAELYRMQLDGSASMYLDELCLLTAEFHYRAGSAQKLVESR